MSTKKNKELIRKYYSEWNELAGGPAKLRSLADKYYPPSYSYHSSSEDLNREQAILAFLSFITAFPDVNYSIDDMVAEGDKVVTRYTLKGTHKGTYMGIPATGKKVMMKGVFVDRIDRGKVLEEWGVGDEASLMTQLGVIPSAPPKN
jgi:steroid delta-isomerase-like uncharacterized protein